MPHRKHHSLTSLQFISFLLALWLLFWLAGQAACRPTQYSENGMDGAQNHTGFSHVETMQTERNIIVSGKMVIELCDVTFTPISMRNGPSAVQVVKSCIIQSASGAPHDSAGSCPSTSTTTITITSMSATATATSTMSNSSTVTVSSQSSASNTSTVSQTTTVSSMNGTTTAASITLSFTSVSALPTTDSAQQTSAPSSGVSSVSSTTLEPSSSIPSTSDAISAPPSQTQTPQSALSSTTTTTLPAMTSPANNVASVAPHQSSALPKVIGAFAGVAVLCLIIAGTIGYLKLKKLNKGDQPIRWPIT